MAGGDGHFMLRQDYKVVEGIMMAEGENNERGGVQSQTALVSSPGAGTCWHCNLSKSLPPLHNGGHDGTYLTDA